jgi:cellulose synthase (UDP-forming)
MKASSYVGVKSELAVANPDLNALAPNLEPRIEPWLEPKSEPKSAKPSVPQAATPKIEGLHTATLVILIGLGVCSLIAGAWFAGFSGVSQFFNAIHQVQQSPPMWLRVPKVAVAYLLLPTVGLLCLGLGITKFSPQPRRWPRAIVITILLVLLGRYLCWRLSATLNLADPANGLLSLLLLGLELLVIFNQSLQLLMTMMMRNRSKQADYYQTAVQQGQFLPSVDVLIPTYNEPLFILKRTVIGCQALDYARKHIYLLDDSRRSEVAALARELGCHYLSRPDRRHAKAGNLNHAIQHTRSELIAVFDADFVPTKNFLQRTVGFFQNPANALVQTYQSFYNPDPIARNLGLAAELPQEAEIFSRFYQPVRDGINTALCYGSSFVVKRSALVATGGFVTESVGEDYFTGIRLAAKGHRVIFLSESLSAGLSAENMAANINQQDRWTRGSLQAFFISANPLTIKGLNWVQRLAHLNGLLSWFGSLAKVGFLVMPLVYAFWGLMPFNTDVSEFVYFFLPFYCFQLVTYAWLNLRSRSAFIADVYSVAKCFPGALSVVQVMLRPFARGFRVTPKGIINQSYVFQWQLAWPLVITLGFTVLGLVRNLQFFWAVHLHQTGIPSVLAVQPIKGLGVSLVWTFYNLFMLTLALLVMLDVPNPERYNWFNLKRQVRLTVDAQISPLLGQTTMMSEAGMQLLVTDHLSQPLTPNANVQIEILETAAGSGQDFAAGLKLEANIERIHRQKPSDSATDLPFAESLVELQLRPLSLAQERHLIELLYCRPGQWQQYRAPGELRSLWLLLNTVWRPRFIFERRPKIQAVNVAQG